MRALGLKAARPSARDDRVFCIQPLTMKLKSSRVVSRPTMLLLCVADDTNIFISVNSEAEAYEKAQLVLSAIIYDYMYAKQFHINIGKSCYMHFRHEYFNKERLVCARTDRNYDRLLSLKICDKKLKQVSKVKFLEVIIHKKLKWEAHIEHLQKKLKLSIIMFKRVKKFILKKGYSKLYNALFTPHLTYCISV